MARAASKLSTMQRLRRAAGSYTHRGSRWALLATAYAGLSGGITLITVFLPPLLQRFTDSALLIGLAIGGEGLFALLVPLLIGPFSDRLGKHLHPRRGLMAIGAILAAAGLALAPFMPNYASTVGVVFAFFVGYYIVMTPYRALTSEVVPEAEYGRALSYQQIMRGLGFVLVVAFGAALFEVLAFVSFLIGAGLLLVAVAITIFTIKEPERHPRNITYRDQLGELAKALRRSTDLRKSFLACFLFEFTLAGLRSFIVLFFVVGLGLPFYWAAIGIGIVAVANLVAAPFAGYLADKFGIRRLLLVANAGYAAALIIPFFVPQPWLVFTVLPPAALLGAAIVTLSFPLILQLMPNRNQGGYSGLFEFARGLGVVAGPLVTGGAIQLYALADDQYQGYQAMWLVLSIASALAALVLWRLNPKVDQRKPQHA